MSSQSGQSDKLQPLQNETTAKQAASRSGISRRDILKIGLMAGGVAAVAAGGPGHFSGPSTSSDHAHLPAAGEPSFNAHEGHGDFSGMVGDIDLTRFDPGAFLTHFDWGRESVNDSGQTVREWDVVAVEEEVEIAPGIFFPGWTFNGQIPGPTFRCKEGELLRFHFSNGSSHPHTIHFHGIHPPEMDGVDPIVEPGGTFTYEFLARPFGLHLYHCHVMQLKKHIHKGLYGTFIIDPPNGREPAHELVMVMNGFDTNFDNENEVYAVNSVAFHYAKHPIQVKVGELVRIYLTNLTEFDPINSFHLHATMFNLYRTGTRLDVYEFTDTVMMCQGERHILEFRLEYPGRYMFHAHQSEFAELGWMGFFEAVA